MTATTPLTHLVWFRNDLRLDDHPSLYSACQTGDRVRAIYCATPGQWQQHHEAGVKLGFRADALNQLGQQLAQLGIPMDLIEAEDYLSLPQQLLQYCQQHHVSQLWFNREIPHDERQRDQQVEKLLTTAGIECHSMESEFVIAPQQVRTLQGDFYKVFTPWYRCWLNQLTSNTWQPLPQPQPLARTPVGFQPLTLPGSEEFRHDIWPASESHALQQLQRFCHERSPQYAQYRDFPAINGTSLMSPYLASGLISIRRCAQVTIETCSFYQQDWRDSTWLRELGWREFYRYLMVAFPKLSRNQPFKPETRFLQWESDAAGVSRWKEGSTGYPIIDAAMRQLNQTGWMHNRLRMLSASFLTKLLLVDWHIGERYFMEKLIDGDFPSNNGGWQWSASTGCDASPWFRVFNPLRQSEKFDPDGVFIRKFLPELASLDNKDIHNPSQQQRQQLNYPAPIVDYRQARERVLQRFRNLNEMVTDLA